MKEYYRVQANINLDAIYNNIKRTREIIQPKTQIMAIIKADGYGHGAIPITKVLDPIIDAYGVALVEEGVELRRAGVKKPILVIGYTPEPLYPLLVKYDLEATVFGLNMAEKLSNEAVKKKKTVRIHLKIDTGMSRIGFKVEDQSIQDIKKISVLDRIEIIGCFTHFARADETDKTFAYSQIDIYKDFVGKLEAVGVTIPIKHVSNSAAIIDLPEANLDMVRSGISTYGLYPSNQVDKSRLLLEPAMEIKACISYIKEVESGIGISYGSVFVTQRHTKVATIPVGYGDGYPRALSSKGRVLIHGKSAPILGRICMDQFMVDITDIDNIQEGDQVTLIGRDGDQFISVEEVSEIAQSINYEFVCDVGKRIPRVFYYKGEKIGTLDYYSCTGETLDLLSI
jgi:alanine racemase